MQGNATVIAALQAALTAEVHSNIQCRQDQRVVKFRGLKKIARHIKTIGDNAHTYQKAITKRLLLLGGDVGVKPQPVEDGDRSLADILQNLLDIQAAIIKPYEDAVQTAMKSMDDTTRNLFEHLLKWHQENDIYWLEQTVNLIKSLGESEYIAAKI